MLRNGLLFRPFDIGTFALDDHQGDAVDEEHDVGTVGVVRARTGDGKLLSDVKHVVFGMLPVDVAHRIALLVAVDALFEGLAEGEHIIHRLIAVEVAAFHRHVAHGGDAVLDILFREARLAVATDADGVQLAQLLPQNVFQQHVGGLPAAQLQCFLRREVLIAQLLQ